MKQIIQIREIKKDEVDSLVGYIKEFRKQLFPMLDHSHVPKDLSCFEDSYLNNPLGCFLEALNHQGERIGVIGMSAYNHRFEYLNYTGFKVVEVARLYVEPAYRRNGIATKLVEELTLAAQLRDINLLYLHTHPFLKGAVEFWQRCGFRKTLTKQESGFVTIHMENKIKTTL